MNATGLRYGVVMLLELAAEINAYHEAAERAIGDALHNARGAGERLIQAKSTSQARGVALMAEEELPGFGAVGAGVYADRAALERD